ncbi:hypothetical protein [Burkholderia contaminans]|uniref:hypothetical protein n=1 Tax=Burkholderia contaminans TaxID=488447 RepID=UPI00158B3248|nr:hypothetical protein [Burkholderia contaminans]
MKTKSTELFEAIMQNLEDRGIEALEEMSKSAQIFAFKYIAEYKEMLNSSWTSKYNNVTLSASREEKIQNKIDEILRS